VAPWTLGLHGHTHFWVMFDNFNYYTVYTRLNLMKNCLKEKLFVRSPGTNRYLLKFLAVKLFVTLTFKCPWPIVQKQRKIG
jgi:hypothetical protein